MRIDRIQVDGFGRLAGLDTGPEALDRLVVVLGPNEAGKSTLFAFLTTALYGFQPATREANPYVPWGASEASGRIHVRLDAGGCVDVERTLRSQPSARMTMASTGAATDLRNQPLPWVEHVPRGVFRQVFAVTLSELAGLDPETWARIQDKVVGSMGASDLRSARMVAEALEREAGEIWRPSRRGNQRLRELQQQARELRARRGAAHERDERVRALVQERENVLAQLDAARTARYRDRDLVERVQTLLPLKQQLDRVAALRAQGGDRGQLDGLPSDPAGRRSALEADREAARQRRAALEADVAENAAVAASFDERARTLLARRDEVAGLVARAAGCAPDRARARELEAEIRELEARLDAAGARLLVGSWREQQEPLAQLPVDVLKDRLTRASTPMAPAPERTPSRGPAIATVVVGLAVLAWGLATGNTPVTVLGGAIALVGVALWLALGPRATAASTRRTLGSPAEDPLAPLRGLRLQPQHLQLGESLVSGLTHLRALLHEHEERVRAVSAARSRVEAVDAQLVIAARELEMGEVIADAEALAALLDAELRRADAAGAAAAQADRESRRLARDLLTADATLASLDSGVAELERKGHAISPGNPAAGLETARARLAAHRRADELEAELQLRHPNLAELEKQIEALARAPEQGTLDARELATVRARIESLGEEIEQLGRRTEALDQSIAHLRDMETVDAVDSEAATLREAEVRLARERDRKWVLARILRDADRRFREEHQPDLLRRAGSYLKHLTGGRYDRLVVDETEGGHLFRLVGPRLPAPVALNEPVSTGTLEQAYLSLRLAIVDHLDRGAERLPLFVDEVFVNWDAERRDRGLEVLAGIAAQRQVFVFTCHPTVADELARRGGRVIALAHSG